MINIVFYSLSDVLLRIGTCIVHDAGNEFDKYWRVVRCHLAEGRTPRLKHSFDANRTVGPKRRTK